MFAITKLISCLCKKCGPTLQILRITAVIAKSFFADLQRSKTCYDILTEKSSDSKGTVGKMAAFSALDPAYFLQSRESAVGRNRGPFRFRCSDDPTNLWITPMSDGAASLPPLRLYTPRPRSRSDWNEIRARIDLTKLAAALLGPPVERRGLRSGSLGWYCPFDEGTSPSFRVILGEATWSCSACGAGGDAAALVMRMKSMAFRDAIAWLDEQEGLGHSSACCRRRSRRSRGPGPRVWRQDPSAIGERPDIMEGAQRLERSSGARPD